MTIDRKSIFNAKLLNLEKRQKYPSFSLTFHRKTHHARCRCCWLQCLCGLNYLSWFLHRTPHSQDRDSPGPCQGCLTLRSWSFELVSHTCCFFPENIVLRIFYPPSPPPIDQRRQHHKSKALWNEYSLVSCKYSGFFTPTSSSSQYQ